jgi:hypothetical protein
MSIIPAVPNPPLKELEKENYEEQESAMVDEDDENKKK